MNKVNSILLIIFSIFLTNCATNDFINQNDQIKVIKPESKTTQMSYFKNRENFQTYNIDDAKSFTLSTHPQELINARALAYKNILSNRLWKYSIKEYYMNNNGIVFITEFKVVDTFLFRDFIRDDFCPLVIDLAQGFRNNRRVIMLDAYAKQGRYMDYTFDVCDQIKKMTVNDANRYIFSKVITY